MKKLICFPYAGGSSTTYNDLKKMLCREYDVVLLDYPGHGFRLDEDLCKTIDETATDAYLAVKEISKVGEYALFGYSMGALVVYEVIRKLELNGDKLPSNVILAASNPPGVKEIEERIFDYDDDEFLKSVIALGGMSDEIMEDEELKSFFAPIIRNDFKQIYDYVKPDDFVINENIVVLYSSEEKYFLGWKDVTSKECKLIQIPGGHFFIHNHLNDVVAILKTVISR